MDEIEKIEGTLGLRWMERLAGMFANNARLADGQRGRRIDICTIGKSINVCRSITTDMTQTRMPEIRGGRDAGKHGQRDG